MSSLAISMMPFCYMSNEMPGWYQVTRAGRNDFAQMNLGCMVLDGYNAWANNFGYDRSAYRLSYVGIWQNMVVSLCGLASTFGSYISGGLYGNGGSGSRSSYTTGNFGSTVQPGSETKDNNGSGKTDGNDDALRAANERAKKAEEEAEAAKKAEEAAKKAAEELKAENEKLKNKKAGG